MRRGVAIGGLAVSLFVFGTTLKAQLNSATVVGTIKDASGAVVPSATVTIRNLGTGLERSVTTDPSGDYTITSLAVGHYSLTATLTQFKTTTTSPTFRRISGTASP
jgi:hypothetical protein